jgi:hypothetical protein
VNLTEALLVAEHPARHEMPMLWAALRVLAPVVHRACDIDERGQFEEGAEVARYILTGEG